MGALADRCPQCGVFLKKGARSCPRCDWEPELFLEASEEKRAFLKGLTLGGAVGVVLGLALALAITALGAWR